MNSVQTERGAAHRRRLGVLVFYDAQGIVDDYLLYLLDDLNACLTDLVVMVNGSVRQDEVEKLKNRCSHLYYRRNNGFDLAAWQEALTKRIGWETIRTYDDLILLNDTFYGPFRPFREIFSEMEEKKVDFWGLTKSNEAIEFGPWPAHLQSYFMVFGKAVLEDARFSEYWERLGPIQTWWDSVNQYEVYLTQKLSEYGYTWESYTDESMYDGEVKENAFAHAMFTPYQLIAKGGCPILKRKTLTMPSQRRLMHNNGDENRKALSYIRERTNYDVSLIWKNLLRKYDVRDIYEGLQLDYVLDEERPPVTEPPRRKVAVVMHLYYMDLLDYCHNYAENIPEYADLIITTQPENKKEQVEEKFRDIRCNRLRVIGMPPKGRDTAGLLLGCGKMLMEYDYVCFVHDKKSARNYDMRAYLSVGQALCDVAFDNTLGSRAYIENVLSTFEREPQLGVLNIPAPVCGYFFAITGYEWTCCLEETQNIADRLGLGVQLELAKMPFSLGTCFWCRTKALEPLFSYDWTPDDFLPEPMPIDGAFNYAIERIMPYVAQSRGFYSGIMMTNTFASTSVSNYLYMFRNITRSVYNKTGTDLSGYEPFLHSVNVRLDQLNACAAQVCAAQAPLAPPSGMKERIKNVARKIFPYGTRRNRIVKKMWARLRGRSS